MSKVFIGMPTYNGERYIAEAIQSILSQSFTDWKLLISDDCSLDNTEKICRNFASMNPRISYIRQEKNLGMSANFDYLLRQCDTPYFMWAAQDDIWRKDFLKTTVRILDDRPDIGVAFTGFINTDSYGRLIREYPHFPEFSGKANLFTVIRYLKSPEIMGKGNLMYALMRTNIASAVNSLYVDKLSWGADVIFAFGCIARGGVIISPDILYEKRHGGFSNLYSTKDDDPREAKKLIFRNPKNHMFPWSKFRAILRGHFDVSVNISHKFIVFIVLSVRSMRALYIYLCERNYKKFFRIIK